MNATKLTTVTVALVLLFVLSILITLGVTFVVHHYLAFGARAVTPGGKYHLDGVGHTLPPHPSSSWFLPLMRDTTARQLKNLLQDAASLMDASGIRFWIAGGTLLGSERHAGFIPWDDDVDLHVDATQKGKFLMAPFVSHGLRLTQIPLVRRDIVRLTRPQQKWPFIDILFEGYDGNGVWGACSNSVNDTAACTATHAAEQWPESWVFPLRTVQFENLRLPAPARSRDVLRRQYGSIDRYKVDLLHWPIHLALQRGVRL